MPPTNAGKHLHVASEHQQVDTLTFQTWQRPHFAWFLSAGVRAGYARLRGEPDDPSVTGTELHGPWLGPTATTGVHIPLTGPIALRVHLDFTYIATPIRGHDATGQPLYAFEGALLGVMLGLAL